MKSMSAPTEGIYRRLTVRMYGDEKFMRLTPPQPCGQWLWVYALTGPHTGAIPGVFVMGKAAMAEALGWESEAFEKAFAEVFGEGLVEFDAKTRIWFIPNAIRHNMPANPNVVRSWRGAWSLLPECAARDRIADALFTSLNDLSDAFGKAFLEASGKASRKPLPKHPPKQETGSRRQEAVIPPVVPQGGPKDAPTIPCPYERIVAEYHQALPDLPRVKLMPTARQRAMRKLWGWVLSSSKRDGTRRATDAESAIAWIRGYFDHAAMNDFLMGRTQRSAEHANWQCDIDYLLSHKGMTQVIEKTQEAA